MELKVGDKVRVIGSVGFYNDRLGEIGEVCAVNIDDYFPIGVLFQDGGLDTGVRGDLELYGEECKVEFKVGDKVKVVGSEGFDYDFEGNIGIIKEIDNYDGNYPVLVKFENERWDWGRLEDLELVHSTMKKKTFKIEQVIEMMREDNSRKFQSAIDSEGEYIQIEDNQIVWRGHKQSGQVFKLGLLDDLWVDYDEIEEVEPKTFQEIVKITSEIGNLVKIKVITLIGNEYYGFLDDVIEELIDNNGTTNLSKIFDSGKWFIYDSDTGETIQ